MLGALAIVTAVVCLPRSATAQESTLAGQRGGYGGYGGPVWKLTSLADQTAVLAGGRGGWIIGHRFVLGGGGYDLVTSVEVEPVDQADPSLDLEMSYGGLELEYVHDSDDLLHWTVHLLIGAGKLSLRERTSDNEIFSGKLFVSEPTLAADLNVTRWFRVGMGVGYRYVVRADADGYEDLDLSAFAGSVILKFGSF